MTETLKALAAEGGASSGSVPPAGTPQAYKTGLFGPVFAWPLIPIHTVLLADGRVLAYGSDDQGQRGAKLHYAVWNPGWNPSTATSEPSSFQLLSNATGTDIFCSTQLVLPASGKVLIIGGSRKGLGGSNNGNADVNVFDRKDNSLQPGKFPMAYRRWYATAVTTDKGEIVVLGGQDEMGRTLPGQPAIKPTQSFVPEVFVPGTGWHTLSGAASPAAYGATHSNWYYPKSWLVEDGRILTIGHDGLFYALDPAQLGTVAKLSGRIPQTATNAVSVMYAPGKILSAREGTTVSLVEYARGQVIARTGAPLSTPRIRGFGTVLPDGKVWLNGGSVRANILEDAVYTSEMWDPATGQWTLTASAVKPRLYHSTALLLPSGAVLTAGGGAPGPVKNLNGELYYPPYFFNPDGTYAARPVIKKVTPSDFSWASPFTVTAGTADPVDQVVMIRTGSATHAFNNDQRRMALEFKQSGSTLTVKAPAKATDMPPGYYMLFILRKNPRAQSGEARLVPSEARMVKLS